VPLFSLRNLILNKYIIIAHQLWIEENKLPSSNLAISFLDFGAVSKPSSEGKSLNEERSRLLFLPLERGSVLFLLYFFVASHIELVCLTI